MAVTLQRELQIPIESVEYSKNRVYVEVTADTLTEAETILSQAFTKQMDDFNTKLEDLKQATDYVKAIEARDFLTYLKKNSPLAQALAQEYTRYKASK
jgi:hypothetical protein